jgi:outer membrane biogenesis lipoprotein LolB
MKTALLLTLACLLLSGCIIVVEQPRDAKPAATASEKK